jgi:hypothetical protein
MTHSEAVIINVKPLKSGWYVDCGQNLLQVFQSGGDAERSAVRLAAAFGKIGRRAMVIVHDRRGAVAGTLDVAPWRELSRQWRTLH